MSGRMRTYCFLFLLTLVTSGGSVAFLSYTAQTTDSPFAREYPASHKNDSYQYAQIAKNIVAGYPFSYDIEEPITPDTSRTPAYPLFLAAFYALFSSFYPALIAQIGIVFLTSLLIFAMAEKVLGTRWAYAVSILYLINPSTMLSASILLTENLFVFFFIASLYTLLFSPLQNLYARWALTGLLLALTAYVRPVALFLPIVIVVPYLFLYRNTVKTMLRTYAAAVCILFFVFAATLTPWFVRNHSVSGVWGFSSISAYALFDANTPYFLAATHGISVSEAKEKLRIRAGLPTDQKNPLDIRYAKVMQTVALEVISAEPFSYARYHLSSVISFLVSSDAHDYWRVYHDMMPDFNPAPEPSLTQALNPFSLPLLIVVIENHGWFLIENLLWAAIIALACIGVWRSHDRKLAGIVLIIVCYFAIATGPISHARYRVPVEPLLYLSALSTVSFFWQRWSDRQHKLSAA